MKEKQLDRELSLGVVFSVLIVIMSLLSDLGLFWSFVRLFLMVVSYIKIQNLTRIARSCKMT